MIKNVDAILLASGFSHRFGTENKLTYPFLNIPLAEHTLKLVCSLNYYNHIYIITAQQEVANLAKKYPVTIIYNTSPHLGQRQSIQLGVSQSTASYYHFFPCDQPLLTTQIIQNILNVRLPNKIVQPLVNNTPKSPVLFSNFYKKDFLNLTNNQTGRTIIKKYQKNVITVPFNTSLFFQDIDTKDTLLQLEKTYKTQFLHT